MTLNQRDGSIAHWPAALARAAARVSHYARGLRLGVVGPPGPEAGDGPSIPVVVPAKATVAASPGGASEEAAFPSEVAPSEVAVAAAADEASEERALPPEKEAILRDAMLKIYPPGFLESPGGPETIEVEIHTRPFWFRKRYVPWLASHMDFSGARILEIGAGTGASAIPLAERGASVTSIDITPTSLEVARVRAGLHGLQDSIRFQVGNAVDIAELFPGATFDLVVYFASLEHMTYRERVTSLRAAWNMLGPGALLAVVDTPNRLWYFDNHTSFANFFHWLPDEVAIDYAARTPRSGFNTEFEIPDAEAPLRMSRWGRGVSFHDFEIAIGALDGIAVSGEWEFRRKHDPAWAEWWSTTNGGRYHEILKAVAPNVPAPFLEEEIALSLRKPG